jgi:transposase-like protein
MRYYIREIKLEAIRIFYEDGKTRAEITELLGIRDPEGVKKWLHQYRQQGEAAFDKKRFKGLIGRPPKKENKDAYISCLKMENELLKKFHTSCARMCPRSAI